MAYIPGPVRRRDIPKPGTDRQRPLGVPTLESKLVEAGLVEILGAISPIIRIRAFLNCLRLFKQDHPRRQAGC